MVEHVRRRSLNAKVIEKIIVASGDREILDSVEKYGGETKQTFKDQEWYFRNSRGCRRH